MVATSSLLSGISGLQTTDGESGLRMAGFLPHNNLLRRSITDYNPSTSPSYSNTFPNASTSALLYSNGPPSYDDALLPPPRFKISPREEEGNEQLPPYSCSLHREAVFEMKMELASPFERATHRNWRKVYVILHGTVLKMYKPKKIPFFSSGKTIAAVEGGKPIEYTPGSSIKCYTLQLAEVGIAADYKKYVFVEYYY
jgi:hypothetical protein